VFTSNTKTSISDGNADEDQDEDEDEDLESGFYLRRRGVDGKKALKARTEVGGFLFVGLFSDFVRETFLVF